MPRPNKILEPTKTYNLLLKEAQYDKLAYAAHQMQKTALEQVAVADLIREAIDIYIEAWEDDQHDSERKQDEVYSAGRIIFEDEEA
tara:strand:+ start:59 stop:316 length:258 start_codon:yes stop_codon:yes gene_type:complete